MSPLVLLPLRPRFAQAIYRGTKRYELRRRRMRVRSGSIVWIYESAPVGKVTGSFAVKCVHWGSPAELLSLCSDDPDQAAYPPYLDGVQLGTALEVADPLRWPRPYALDEICGRPTRAPQSYCFLREVVPRRLP
ncbi:MAG: hypothetical protein B7733_21690 [Myxococcales bacterium FL481]|nr:MAG: hypothetical protein B7733_21690 [Myxococcales bacterium FL481]